MDFHAGWFVLARRPVMGNAPVILVETTMEQLVQRRDQLKQAAAVFHI